MSLIKRIFTRRHTDAPAFLTRQITMQLAVEEGVDFAQSVLNFAVAAGHPWDGHQNEHQLKRLQRWADDIIHIYGPTAAALKKERGA